MVEDYVEFFEVIPQILGITIVFSNNCGIVPVSRYSSRKL